MFRLFLLLGGCAQGGLFMGDPGPGMNDGPGGADTDDDTGGPDTDVEIAPPTSADALYVEGTIHDFGLTLDEAAIASLTANPALDVPAVFTHAGSTLDVAVHIKGSHSLRTLDAKAAFKIDFDDYVPNQRFLGLEHLTLNNMLQDRSMIREHAAYWMFDKAGVPSPRHGYARVSVNGTPFGLYGIVETLDQHYLKRRFPGDADGNLYETLSARGDITSERQDYFELKRGLAPDGVDIAALVATVDAATPENYLEVLGTVFDADELLSFLALDIVLGHDDGYVTSCNNFLLYNAPNAGKWHLVPWGQDQTFDEESLIYSKLFEGQLAVRCFASPACKAAFDAKVREVADLWETAALAAYVTQVETVIEADCEADLRKEHNCSARSLLEYIQLRPDFVRSQLP